MRNSTRTVRDDNEFLVAEDFAGLCSLVSSMNRSVKDAVKNGKCVGHCKVKGQYASEIRAELQPMVHHWFNSLVDSDCTARSEWYNLLRATEVDVYGAGWPCQPWSNAGEKGGSKDLRHKGPFFSMLDFLKVKRPKIAVLENVHVVQLQKQLMKQLQQALRAAGYVWAIHTINTNAYVPQNRLRTYIVAVLSNVGTQHDVDTCFQNEPDESSALDDLLSLNVDEHWFTASQALAAHTGIVFHRNFKHAEDALTKNLADECFAVADFGASAQRPVATVDECPCITAARGAQKRLWVLHCKRNHIVKLRPLTHTELLALQGWQSPEIATIMSNVKATSLGHAIGNGMSQCVLSTITDWAVELLQKARV